jgi:hypothetical protein
VFTIFDAANLDDAIEAQFPGKGREAGALWKDKRPTTRSMSPRALCGEWRLDDDLNRTGRSVEGAAPRKTLRPS